MRLTSGSLATSRPTATAQRILQSTPRRTKTYNPLIERQCLVLFDLAELRAIPTIVSVSRGKGKKAAISDAKSVGSTDASIVEMVRGGPAKKTAGI